MLLDCLCLHTKHLKAALASLIDDHIIRNCKAEDGVCHRELSQVVHPGVNRRCSKLHVNCIDGIPLSICDQYECCSRSNNDLIIKRCLWLAITLKLQGLDAPTRCWPRFGIQLIKCPQFQLPVQRTLQK